MYVVRLFIHRRELWAISAELKLYIYSPRTDSKADSSYPPAAFPPSPSFLAFWYLRISTLPPRLAHCGLSTLCCLVELDVFFFGYAHATVSVPMSQASQLLVRSSQSCSNPILRRRAIWTLTCCRGLPALLHYSSFLSFSGLVDFLTIPTIMSRFPPLCRRNRGNDKDKLLIHCTTPHIPKFPLPDPTQSPLDDRFTDATHQS